MISLEKTWKMTKFFRQKLKLRRKCVADRTTEEEARQDEHCYSKAIK